MLSKVGARGVVAVRKGFGWFGQVVAWVVILFVALTLATSVLIPRLAGATPYVILTSSMTPNMPPGTLVVVRPKPTNDIGIGDVVTYQLDSGRPTVVTHRIVAIGFSTKGTRVFRTKGDANSAADVKPVMPVQIKGVRWYYIPYLGYVTNFVTGKERHITTIVVISGLLLYAAFMFTSSARDRFSKSKHRSSVSPS